MIRLLFVYVKEIYHILSSEYCQYTIKPKTCVYPNFVDLILMLRFLRASLMHYRRPRVCPVPLGLLKIIIFIVSKISHFIHTVPIDSFLCVHCGIDH